ncbi:MAG: hypothetical protein ACYSW8_33360 [Planctomycetota bacterium]|jgi:hypothetical protein
MKIIYEFDLEEHPHETVTARDFKDGPLWRELVQELARHYELVKDHGDKAMDRMYADQVHETIYNFAAQKGLMIHE